MDPVCLRPYQERAIQDLRARIAAGVRRIVIVAPTGSGKTTIAAHIIATAVEHGSRVLFLAHRRELINQAYDRLIRLGVPENHLGVLMSQDRRRRPGAPVQVASVDTLRNRAKPLADIVFVDECHRAMAKTYRDISDYYKNAIHLGLTATPYRADGAGLGDIYSDLLLVSSPKQLIDEGYLIEPRVFTIPRLPDLSAVRIKRGDYDQQALANAMDAQTLVGNIVEHWQRLADGVLTVAFASSVAHSKHIAGQFLAAGIAAEHLDGATPTRDRDAMLERLQSGKTRIVCNCGVLCEGWDQPAVKCAILARPTRSTGLYLQQAGRILRPWNSQRAIILDHSGCVLEHGLPQDDRVFSLENKKNHNGRKTTAPVKTCPSCFAILPLGTRACPECGAVLVADRELPQECDGALIEISLNDIKRIELGRLQAIAEERGYRQGWIYYRYYERFGEPPPPSRPRPNLTSIDGMALRDTLRQSVRSGGTISWDIIDRIKSP